MDINELKSALETLTNNSHVPFVLGKPGQGKSDAIKQFAQLKAREANMEFYEGPENFDEGKFGFIDLRLATIDTVDLSGLPLIDRDVRETRFTRSPYIPGSGQGILFLDELPQAKAGNQAAVSQLILDKRVGAHALGENWSIVTAGNRAEDRAATHKMPTHIANRLVHLELDFSLEAFIDYMHETNVEESAIAFAKFRPELLESFKADNDINCTPRSFISASKYAHLDSSIMYPLMSGTIGEGATAEYIGFLKIFNNVPDIEEFIKKPTKLPIPDQADLLFATVQRLSFHANDKNIDQLAKFIERLSEVPEYIVTFWKTACKRDPNLALSKPFTLFTEENEDLMLNVRG